LPYIPFDTGWTQSIYGLCIASWFIVSRRLLTPKYLFSLFYNFIYGPLVGVLFKSIDLIMTTIGTSIICAESVVFNKFDYISPVYITLKLIGSILPPIQSYPRPMYPKSKSKSKSNTNKSSSGRHLCKYFARKRQQSKKTIISPGLDYYCSSHIRTATQSRPSSHPTSSPASRAAQCLCPSSPPTLSLAPSTTPCSPFRSIYDTFSRIGSYVLTHQVISTGDTISVSFLPPHAKPILQPKHRELRSVGDNVDQSSSATTSIALDSASSIHLFKDRSLLDNIKADAKKKMKVLTTDSTFHVNDIGELCASLKSLPLPHDGYYFYPKGVANILSLALLAKKKRVIMDTAIENAFYVFNEDGSYVKFVPSNNGMYCLDIGPNNDPYVMAIQTVKDEQSKFSNID
jgi:hypothetical protein